MNYITIEIMWMLIFNDQNTDDSYYVCVQIEYIKIRQIIKYWKH